MNFFVEATNPMDNLKNAEAVNKPTVVLNGRNWNTNRPFCLDGTKSRHVIQATNATVVAHLSKPEAAWIKNIEITNLGPQEVHIGALATELAAGTSVVLHFDGSEWSEVSRDLNLNKGEY